jgi:uncharacterized cupredoxin-like copper-binding protein
MAARNTAGPVSGLAMLTSLFAVMVAVVAVVVVSTNEDSGGGAVASASVAVEVGLADFFIDPDPVVMPEGGSLAVSNTGNTAHNLAVQDQDLTTADLQPGSSEDLDLSSLAAGEYEVYCTIPGHADQGMRAALQVGGAAGTTDDTGTHATSHDGADESDAAYWANLDTMMQESFAPFPAETEGVGNQPLEPVEVTEDGTKVFELTAEITDWEVEPGKVVRAWTYNGMVPGPWIDLDLNDKVRIIVHNRLPMGTDVHWHGVDTPFDQDGVSPITQTLIAAGEDFTYEFVADEPAVAMYHAHHHGQLQIPNGLFAALTIGDLPLPPAGTIGGIEIPENIEVSQEFPMVLNDAGVIGLSLNGKSFPATAPVVAEVGDWIEVHYYSEGLQAHPMHLHNYPQLVIAKDGYPLEQPYWADTINVAPGERYSVLIYIDEPGTFVWHCHILTHAERDTGMFGMVTAIVATEPE